MKTADNGLKKNMIKSHKPKTIVNNKKTRKTRHCLHFLLFIGLLGDFLSPFQGFDTSVEFFF